MNQITLPALNLPRHEWTLLCLDGQGQPLDPGWELKDPSIVSLPDGRYRLYASVGSSVTQTWMIGMFEAETLTSPWYFKGRTEIDLIGDRVCAPAVNYHAVGGDMPYVLDVQSECFYLPDRKCEIFRAYSADGHNFVKAAQPLISLDHLRNAGYNVLGAYDPGTSVVSENGQNMEVMLFSAYRHDEQIEAPRLFGDIYMVSRPFGDDAVRHPEGWSAPKLIIDQDRVPFHNRPFTAQAEWGIEGAKVIQLGNNLFLWVFVSFLEGVSLRQRVTWATSRSIFEEPRILGVTYPAAADTENGHSDIFLEQDRIVEIRQQRHGRDGQWYLTGAEYKHSVVTARCEEALGAIMPAFVNAADEESTNERVHLPNILTTDEAPWSGGAMPAFAYNS